MSGNAGNACCGCFPTNDKPCYELRDGIRVNSSIDFYELQTTEPSESDMKLQKEVEKIFDKYDVQKIGKLSAKDLKPYIKSVATHDLGDNELL